MKSLSPELQSHLDEGTTTLAWCWRITRADGQVFGFTDHDLALSFDGTSLEPESGLKASELRASGDLAVDAQDAEGVLRSGVITEADIAAGLWDGAAVEVWRVNWQDTSQRVLMRRGTIGEIRRGRVAFTAEMRSLAHVLDQPLGRSFQAGCDAVLGDGRCGIDLENPAWKGAGTVAGQAIGASIGGGLLGISAATIGGAIGTMAGSVVDSWIVGSLQPDQRYEGARLDSLRVTSATEGTTIPRLFGRMRLGGNIIWATDFTEHVSTTTQGGGKGGGPTVTTTEYSYTASFAVVLCEGPITGIGRIWADGELLDTSTATWRWYPGDEVQAADPFIAAKMGAEGAPAYRGTAYVVFEELDLTSFGNRIPQLSFEVFRPLADPDTAEGAIRAVTMIPGAGEFVYATEPVMRVEGAKTKPENVHAETDRADFPVSLDRLEALAPGVESVSLVVSWFGSDLRAGHCAIRPGVETATKTTTPQVWQVNGAERASAHLVSTDAEGRPIYGGTPSDAAVVQAIKALKARGYRVTFYPFLLMDVPEGNSLPNPYSDNAATLGQPALPWRGRITCSPAPGYAGSVDKTATAASQVAAFFGNARVSDFAVSGETVAWTGGNDWGWRRMILHYAHLCAAAGGVDAFLIGSELRGLTGIRDSAATYPAVAELQSLAADVRAILGVGTAISYAADWSEYFGHQPADGLGDVFFHLDPLWADAEIDFIGIDNYIPLSDWRDGFEHLDAQAGWPAIYDRAYLQTNITGGEGFDWFYASQADRTNQIRTPITDGAYGKDWVFRYKDLRAWWSNPHFDRPGGVESHCAHRALSAAADCTCAGRVPRREELEILDLNCDAGGCAACGVSMVAVGHACDEHGRRPSHPGRDSGARQGQSGFG